jgi:Tol biopolymer transport system component
VILFQRSDYFVGAPFISNGIYRIDEFGRGLRRLTQERPYLDLRAPTWAPDAKRIAYYRATEPCAVLTMRPDGTDRKVLLDARVPGIGSCRLGALAWSADGRSLGFEVGSRYCYTAKITDTQTASLVEKPRFGCLGVTWLPAETPGAEH